MTEGTGRIRNTDVPFKTSAGRAETIRRTGKLDPLERTLLIVVDGRQSFAALFAALGRSGEDPATAGAVRKLLELGLVEVQPGQPAGRATQRRSLGLARLYLMESMERALRGQTAPLQTMLLAVTDEASLRHAIDVCHETLQAAGAASQADVIRARCLDLLP